MFCTSLRRRSSFAPAIPSLISPSGLALKESQLDTHDVSLALPDFANIGSAPKPKRMLRLLLLSPNNLSEARLESTLSRILHFASLTGGVDVAVVLTLSAPKPFVSAKSLVTAPQTDDTDGLRSYTLLQAELMARSDIPWIPILPLAKLDGLADLIKSHSQAIARPKPKSTSAVRPRDLLAHCTAEPPLPALAVNLTSDVFSSLDHLAHAAITHHSSTVSPDFESVELGTSDDALRSEEDAKTAFDMLTEQLGEIDVNNMLDFWADDWVVE